MEQYIHTERQTEDQNYSSSHFTNFHRVKIRANLPSSYVAGIQAKKREDKAKGVLTEQELCLYN